MILLEKKPIIEGMVVIGFPVIIKRNHFVDIRKHITNQMNTTSFENAFHKMCCRFPGGYSQFTIMINYLWYFKRDEYSWHIRDNIDNTHPAMQNGRLTDNIEVLKENKPIVGLMKHDGHINLFSYYSDYICVASNWTAGDCSNFYHKDIDEGVKLNMLVDWIYETGYWNERLLPNIGGSRKEKPWENNQYKWEDIYKIHYNNVKNRTSKKWL
jgi:hypothetical protein